MHGIPIPRKFIYAWSAINVFLSEDLALMFSESVGTTNQVAMGHSLVRNKARDKSFNKG